MLNQNRCFSLKVFEPWRTLFISACILLLPASVHATVSIDQVPLTVQKQLAPNIVLMLDDSGSMQSDFMPDWNYLSDTSDDGVRDSSVNGTYYDPDVIYSPPPTANGGSYPNSGTDSGDPMGTAYMDGFHSGAGTTDVTTYQSPTERFPYYERYTAQVTTSYPPVPGCNSGDTIAQSGQYAGQCIHAELTYTYYAPSGHGRGHGNNVQCNSGDQYDFGSRQCVHTETTYTYYPANPSNPTCPNGGSYDSGQNACVRPQNVTANLFTYTEVNPNGKSPKYIKHYVGKSQEDCSVALAADTTQGVSCDYSTVTQQNVANWFSYYSTRILLAKSGVMNAFSDLDSTFRVGFSSINGTNNDALPSPTKTYNNKMIAEVEPLGDGSNNTQKAALWSWLVGINPNNSTPLRQSLDAVGQYYGSDQPWQTSDSDTLQLACRQSYTILTTDGFWNGNTPSNIGNVDNTTGPTLQSPNAQTYNYTPASPYSDSTANTLADVAMKYWDTDLKPNISNEVPPSTEDPAFWQHMATFTLGLGFSPTGIKPDGTTIDQIFAWADGGAAIPGFSWPTPSSNNINNIADLAHAAVNGHGGFYSATSPQAFASGVVDALKRVAERVGTGASLAANSTKLDTGTTTYQAVYYTGLWKGDLKAYSVDSNTGVINTVPTWTAASVMPTAANRNIYTYNSSGTGNKFVSFNASNLSSAELNALGSTSTEQSNIVNYLRGNDTLEQKNGGIYRNRDTALGDIVDSQPVYVGAPGTDTFSGRTFDGSSTYATFASNEASRSPLIWIAANDGMLHAFDAATGSETFAYLPAAVIKTGIQTLSDPNYGNGSTPHILFNDGEVTVADVYINSAWATVLVGTTGRGPSKAVYALDITDPSAPTLLWERAAGDTQGNDGYIGEMVGKPVIAQTANGTWSVLIGNGYNSTQNTAALLQFDLATGTLTVHTTDGTANNGLAAPAVWIDDPSDGVATTAYAGDLYGRVWSFDLTSAGNSPTILFSAQDKNGKAQPITDGMLAGQDPSTGNLWLFFGTGRYLAQTDLSDASEQTWYGIIVQSNTAGLVGKLSGGRANLAARSITGEQEPVTTPPSLGIRTVSVPTAGDMANKAGWYMDLISPKNGDEGERMVTPNQFQGTLLIGTTRIPQSSDPCNPSGRGWIMAIDPFTGGNPAAVFFDTNGDGKFDDSDKLNGLAAAGIGFISVPNNPIFVGNTMLTSFDNATTSSIGTAGTVGVLSRVSWRELVTQ